MEGGREAGDRRHGIILCAQVEDAGLSLTSSPRPNAAMCPTMVGDEKRDS
jgi:hypothetical protein